MSSKDPLQALLHYRRLDQRVATSGQPREDQLDLISQTGIEQVINLGMHDGAYALLDESRSLFHLKVGYDNLPVRWQAPDLQSLYRFFRLLDRYQGKSLLIHCAANKRVSVFMYLYRRLELGLSHSGAWPDVEAIWQPNQVWQDFIGRALAAYGEKQSTGT